MNDSEIIKALECCKNLNCSACPKKTNIFVTDCDVKLCEEAIDLIKRQQTEIDTIKDTMPAADVVEVKHGKWIEKETYLDIYYDCSICGESFCFIEGSPTDNLYKYCPNCGAKMEGKEVQE